MTWLEQWRDLAARIDGLIRAGEFLVSAFKVNRADAHGVVRKSFQPELVAIIAEIEHLGKTYECELPEQASAALKKYVTQGWDKNFNDGASTFKHLLPSPLFAHSSNTSFETPRLKGGASRNWRLSIFGDSLWWIRIYGRNGKMPSRNTNRPVKGSEPSIS